LDIFKCHRGCCEDSCGCESSCGCGAEAGAAAPAGDAVPMPPTPKADASASLSGRRVIASVER
jgi:hypothetical protein